MANEIWHSYEEGNTLYALIWRKTDDKVYDQVAAANTFDTYTDAGILTYDLPLENLDDSNYYSIDFPGDIAAGVYRVQIFLQAGGSAHADNDMEIAQGEIYWDGDAEINIYTLDTSINDDIIGVDGDTLESLSDQLDEIATEENKTLNVYGPGE